MLEIDHYPNIMRFSDEDHYIIKDRINSYLEGLCRFGFLAQLSHFDSSPRIEVRAGSDKFNAMPVIEQAIENSTHCGSYALSDRIISYTVLFQVLISYGKVRLEIC